MEAADYTELLRQAEEELGKTPGAYCKRAVAVRAMELLREAGQKEVDEATKNYNVGVANQAKLRQELQQTIERQAEAIKRLEAEKTQRIGLQSKNDIGLVKSGLRGEIQRARDKYVMGVDPIDLDPEEPGIGITERFRRVQLINDKRRRMEAERSPFRKPWDPTIRLNDYLDHNGPGWQTIDK